MRLVVWLCLLCCLLLHPVGPLSSREQFFCHDEDDPPNFFHAVVPATFFFSNFNSLLVRTELVGYWTGCGATFLSFSVSRISQRLPLWTKALVLALFPYSKVDLVWVSPCLNFTSPPPVFPAYRGYIFLLSPAFFLSRSFLTSLFCFFLPAPASPGTPAVAAYFSLLSLWLSEVFVLCQDFPSPVPVMTTPFHWLSFFLFYCPGPFCPLPPTAFTPCSWVMFPKFCKTPVALGFRSWSFLDRYERHTFSMCGSPTWKYI